KTFVNVIFELRKKYGGLVTRLDFGDKGCNMLLLWGAPVAFENDIGRALNFILDLRSKVDIPITAGVTYYIAHAGYLGSTLCEDYTCYGWGVNLAARFMMSAPTGEIWVDDRIAQRVSQRFALDHVGSQRFKGFAAEQKVHVLRYKKTEAEVVYQGEMVGRKDELNRMKEFVEPLWKGKFAGVLTVSGEAGIGKGRLVYEFSSSDLFKENSAYWANCKANQILRQAFNPIRGWLLRYFESQQKQSMDERKAAFDLKLDNLLASLPDPELGRELDRTRSFLGALIDLHWDKSLYEQLDAEARYNNTILSLIALLKAESLRQPLVFFLDDIQFIDQDTMAFLEQLKRSLLTDKQHYPIVIILTLRKLGETPPSVGELSDSEIWLVGIDRYSIAKLAENILGSPASMDLMRLVLSRSEGNPYFAEQVIRYLQEEGQLEESENGWGRVKQGRGSVLPGDIRALLVARLDKLVREVKDAVHTASVLGREFDFGVLAQMMGSELSTKEYVDKAEKDSIWSAITEVRYIFFHGLLRDAAYSMQMHARRQELHTLALNALEIIYEDEIENHYAELAYHAEQAEIRSKAQRYYTLAGKASGELYRNGEAIEYFTKAYSLTDLDDLENQFDLLAERSALYSRIGKRDLQLKDLESLDQLANQLKDNAYLAKVMMFRSAYSYFIGNYDESIDYAVKAENTSESLINSEQKLYIYTQVVWCTDLIRLGRLDDAMRRAQVALEHSRAVGNKHGESRMLNTLGLVALEMKDPSPSLEYFSEALIIARELNIKDVESKIINNLAMAEVSINGDYALAHKYYQSAVEIAHEIGDRVSETTSLVNLGFSAGVLGDFHAARSYHERSLLLARESGNRFQEIYTLINLSALAGIQNDADMALQQAQLAADLADATAEPSGQAWAFLYMGHAYLLNGEYELAQTAFQKSVDIRNDLDQQSLSMEPLAGLVEANMAMNDITTASHQVEKIIAFISSGSPLEGTDEPLRVYYICYRYLEKTKDPRAQQILKIAKKLLDAQVSKFSNDLDRERYVENLPWRRAIRDAARVYLD
ncbi:MAG TPA: AAA family ATPase, partial [Anaerolineales bacterium]|nr:AAA family ATPase [Anaerolineales bacterium]